ncbi:MAG TPA: hypothetical protein VIL65_10780 [Beijerinckiaceae bacterium]|jgi:hypothetical protein
MSSHPHSHHHAVAAEPTLSLLRLSAAARCLGGLVLAGGLWILIAAAIA